MLKLASTDNLLYLLQKVKRQYRLWLSLILSLTAAYYLLLLTAAIVRFGQLPNYFIHYDFISGIGQIVAGTPAWSDVWMIAQDEVWLELGFMDAEYGIAQWSLSVLPSKLLALLLQNGLIALLILLIKDSQIKGACTSAKLTATAASLAAGLGNVTLSWVVCCSAPSWVVGLAMLGMSSSLALALEPLGYLINLFAYGGLLLALNLLADRGLQSERKNNHNERANIRAPTSTNSNPAGNN
ncbi:MAG: hypothetical protein MJK13_05500 [Pseudomonadales bacterium]|nr:hypothetical protein [Pseudomonadales bacterium]